MAAPQNPAAHLPWTNPALSLAAAIPGHLQQKLPVIQQELLPRLQKGQYHLRNRNPALSQENMTAFRQLHGNIPDSQLRTLQVNQKLCLYPRLPCSLLHLTNPGLMLLQASMGQIQPHPCHSQGKHFTKKPFLPAGRPQGSVYLCFIAVHHHHSPSHRNMHWIFCSSQPSVRCVPDNMQSPAYPPPASHTAAWPCPPAC